MDYMQSNRFFYDLPWNSRNAWCCPHYITQSHLSQLTLHVCESYCLIKQILTFSRCPLLAFEQMFHSVPQPSQWSVSPPTLLNSFSPPVFINFVHIHQFTFLCRGRVLMPYHTLSFTFPLLFSTVHQHFWYAWAMHDFHCGDPAPSVVGMGFLMRRLSRQQQQWAPHTWTSVLSGCLGR